MCMRYNNGVERNGGGNCEDDVEFTVMQYYSVLLKYELYYRAFLVFLSLILICFGVIL